MDELSENFQNEDLENLIIKDNEYKKKQRLKCFAIIFPIILVLAAITIVIIILSLYKGGILSCIYITKEYNESVTFLNEKIFEKYNIKIKIDENSIDKTNTYIFPNPGKHSITFKFKEKIDSLENFFEGVDKLYEVDLSHLNFEENKITSLSKLFYNCINLKNININITINTKIASTSEMLYNCQSLESIDFLNILDASNVLNMSYMFAECVSLNISNISLVTDKVQDISRMFYHCANLTSIENLEINTSQVTNFSGVFELCENLMNINLSNLETSKGIFFQNFFSGCKSLTSIDLYNINTSNAIDISSFFFDCGNLISLNLNNFNTNKVINLSGMFSNCRKLISLNLDNFNTENVMQMEELFLGCENLENIDMNNFNFNKVQDMSYMFANCEKFKKLKIGVGPQSFEKVKSIRGICYGCKKLENFEFNVINDNLLTFKNINDMSLAFANCPALKEIKIENINTNDNIAMNEMFLNCESMTEIDFSPFFKNNNNKNIRISNMQKIFKNCTNLKKVVFSNFNLAYLYDFSEAFYNCNSLTSLDLSNYSFKNVFYMDRTFYNCSNLAYINLPQNLINVINAKNLFDQCIQLKEINLNNFNGNHKLMNISGMFKNCFSLKNVELTMEETRYLLNMDEMFYQCIQLESVKFNHFKTDRLKSINKLFYDCLSLKKIEMKNIKIPEPINIDDIFKKVSNRVEVDYSQDNLFDDLIQEINNIKNN